jgi:hypothetical protein
MPNTKNSDAKAATTASDTARPIARPLNVLIPLIKDDLDQAHQAGVPFFRAAGEKLIEARAQLSSAEFAPWAKRHFRISRATAYQYMRLAKGPSSALDDFPSLSAFIRQTSSNPFYNLKSRLDEFSARLGETNSARQQAATERELQWRLALEVIDTGFKALALKLHPDRGGSSEAMQRLNIVRDRLRKAAR